MSAGKRKSPCACVCVWVGESVEELRGCTFFCFCFFLSPYLDKLHLARLVPRQLLHAVEHGLERVVQVVEDGGGVAGVEEGEDGVRAWWKRWSFFLGSCATVPLSRVPLLWSLPPFSPDCPFWGELCTCQLCRTATGCATVHARPHGCRCFQKRHPRCARPCPPPHPLTNVAQPARHEDVAGHGCVVQNQKACEAKTKQTHVLSKEWGRARLKPQSREFVLSIGRRPATVTRTSTRGTPTHPPTHPHHGVRRRRGGRVRRGGRHVRPCRDVPVDDGERERDGQRCVCGVVCPLCERRWRWPAPHRGGRRLSLACDARFVSTPAVRRLARPRHACPPLALVSGDCAWLCG